eukprot:TRINITY_DN2367_c0_g1_i1.p1 TRINITY_DN2367_c0_g1~~TRINITY_DN2367_c0_g1_i1.p1  ORF type:complete len:273 (-),score=25.83 TRINITY_DN2367_c0_g1_i1:263-1081(-)
MVKCGFCGAGVMASALANGLIRSAFCTESDISAFDVYPEATVKFINGRNMVTCKSNLEVAKLCDVLFICVKPHMVSTVLKEFKSWYVDNRGPLIISIAAGVTCEQMQQVLPSARIVRVMPNTPCLVGESASAYVGGQLATPEDLELTKKILSSVGLAIHVPLEKDLDTVTGLSGSGPAYVFVMIEALADGGVRAGLTRQVALSLAIQTVKGAAIMLQQTGSHPGILKDQVCSPGGTTITGVEALEKNGFRYATISAVTSATERARDLKNSKL